MVWSDHCVHSYCKQQFVGISGHAYLYGLAINTKSPETLLNWLGPMLEFVHNFTAVVMSMLNCSCVASHFTLADQPGTGLSSVRSI